MYVYHRVTILHLKKVILISWFDWIDLSKYLQSLPI